jgi:hypothetical protein
VLPAEDVTEDRADGFRLGRVDEAVDARDHARTLANAAKSAVRYGAELHL